jgi:hypothetical protein
MANTNIAPIKAHGMKEPPRSQDSNAVKSNPPRATLIMMMLESCQRIIVFEGAGVMRGMLHGLVGNGRAAFLSFRQRRTVDLRNCQSNHQYGAMSDGSVVFCADEPHALHW